MAGFWPFFFLAYLKWPRQGRSQQKQEKEQGQYPAIVMGKAWSIKHLLILFSRD